MCQRIGGIADERSSGIESRKKAGVLSVPIILYRRMRNGRGDKQVCRVRAI